MYYLVWSFITPKPLRSNVHAWNIGKSTRVGTWSFRFLEDFSTKGPKVFADESEYMKIHIFELRKKQWINEWSSQLYGQLKQLRKESLKKIQAWTGFEPMTSAIPVQCSTNWAIKPTGHCVNALYTRWGEEMKVTIWKFIYLFFTSAGL